MTRIFLISLLSIYFLNKSIGVLRPRWCNGVQHFNDLKENISRLIYSVISWKFKANLYYYGYLRKMKQIQKIKVLFWRLSDVGGQWRRSTKTWQCNCEISVAIWVFVFTIYSALNSNYCCFNDIVFTNWSELNCIWFS
jgi:hypothetical protein